MNNGKQLDVIVRENEIETELFTVWADSGLQNKFKQIEGVTCVYNFLSPTQYEIGYDPRYDPAFIKAEIVAVAKIK